MRVNERGDHFRPVFHYKDTLISKYIWAASHGGLFFMPKKYSVIMFGPATDTVPVGNPIIVNGEEFNTLNEAVAYADEWEQQFNRRFGVIEIYFPS